MPVATNSAYEGAVADLLRLGHELHATPAHKFDLAHMRTLLAALGNPERRFPSLLIAGTNGKGSTAAILYSILCAAGYRAALYTSPHLVRVNERIRINHDQISDPEFAEIHQRVEEIASQLVARGNLPWHPSFFEMLTAMAFEYFASARAEIAVLEVGMGGRLDATNVVDPLLSIITDISLDHQNFLGTSIREIAGEKAGIIRAGGVVVTLSQHPEANEVIGNAILKSGARASNAVAYMPPVSPGAQPFAGDSFPVGGGSSPSQPQHRYPLSVCGEEIIIESPLVGRHQLRNAALAIAAGVELREFGFSVAPQEIAAGIRATDWPGRFQVFPATAHRPETVVDVAHNPAGAWALRSALSQFYAGRHLILVFGCMRDKAMSEMAGILFPLAESAILTQAQSPRAATPEEIRDAALNTATEMFCESKVPLAVERARQLARSADAFLVITGSIYIVGEALELLRQ
jgi:dihydrofolate synthase / folylpolyglutamate synthase